MPADVLFGLASASGDLTEGAIEVPAIGTAVSADGEIVQYDLLMINGAGSAGCRIVGSLVQLS
jgi:malic enzyme